MSPDEALGALQDELGLELGAGWEGFRGLVRGLARATAWVEWSLKVRPGGLDSGRVLWACRYRDTGAVAGALGRGLLSREPEVHRRLTHGAMNLGLGWDGTHGALKVYAGLRPGTLRFEAIAGATHALRCERPPVQPTVTIGFVRGARGWKARHYCFWKRSWLTPPQRRWLEPVLGRGWAEALASADRGGFILRETGGIDVALGLAPDALDRATSGPWAPALAAVAGRETRLAGRLGELTWLTAPLSQSPHPGALREFNLYLRPAPRSQPARATAAHSGSPASYPRR